MSERPRLTAARRQTAAEKSRLLPLTVAGGVCFGVALGLGYGGWYLFGTHDRAERERAPEAVTQSAAATPSPEAAAVAPPVKLAPAGEVAVAGGEVALGGGETGVPLRRVVVEPFAIAETEVTNEQYREFVRAANYKAPTGWKDGEFPPGAALEPVTEVTWNDAVEYCKWLSNEIGAEVRLPTEAEWELAARGTDGRKYPWGNEWDARAADSAESHGRVRAVRSFPAGKSPAGAYDMAGNVWEWVSDEFLDPEGRVTKTDDVKHHVFKGGSAKEERALISAASRYHAVANESAPQLGFRYVVVRRK